MMLYTFMNKNTAIMDVEIDEVSNQVTSLGDVYNSSYAPISVDCSNRVSIVNWYRSRSIPASRDKLRQGLSLLGLDEATVNHISLKSLTLSLSDQYWMKPSISNLTWHDVNFFENTFSEDVGIALFDNLQVANPSLMSPDGVSGGWLRKKWKIIDNKRYLIKGGSGTIQQEPYNEVIANIVASALGIKNYVEYKVENYRGLPVSLCENFITPDTELVSASSIQSHYDRDATSTKYEHFVSCCQRLNIPNISNSLDDMLACDFIIANQDRHTGNFGAIRDVNTLDFLGFAPIYDSGTSLRYDTPTPLIDAWLSVESQPFMSFHSEQIKLIRNPERFNIPDIRIIKEQIIALFSEHPSPARIDEERIEKICSVIGTRINMFDKALCKGLTSGITIQKNTSHRSR